MKPAVVVLALIGVLFAVSMGIGRCQGDGSDLVSKITEGDSFWSCVICGAGGWLPPKPLEPAELVGDGSCYQNGEFTIGPGKSCRVCAEESRGFSLLPRVGLLTLDQGGRVDFDPGSAKGERPDCANPDELEVLPTSIPLPKSKDDSGCEGEAELRVRREGGVLSLTCDAPAGSPACIVHLERPESAGSCCKECDCCAAFLSWIGAREDCDLSER